MDVSDLQIFLTVADELHFGRAAQRLHLAQPYVSRTVRNLEKDLGVTLFERTTRKVELTSAGHALVTSARAIVTASAEARTQVKAAERGESGRVRLSFAGPSSYAAIGSLARAVRERHPQIELVFKPGRFGPEVFEQVIDGTTDLGIARFKKRPFGISARPIAVEHYVLAVPSTHRLASAESVSIADLRDELFLTLPPFPGSIVLTDFVQWCHNAGFAPNVVQTAPDSWTIIALVAAGVGVTFTVDTAIEHVPTDGVHIVRLEEAVAPTYAYLVWRKDTTNAALRTVIRTSEQVFPMPPGVLHDA